MSIGGGSRSCYRILIVSLMLGMTDGIVVSEIECSADGNAHWKAKACFCDDGYSPASYHGGHPCIKHELVELQYCAIDKQSYWDYQKKECFCDDDTEPWRGEAGGHPCVDKQTMGLKIRKAVCDGDQNAGWDVGSLNCFCNDGYEPANNDAGGHPCRAARDL